MKKVASQSLELSPLVFSQLKAGLRFEAQKELVLTRKLHCCQCTAVVLVSCES